MEREELRGRHGEESTSGSTPEDPGLPGAGDPTPLVPETTGLVSKLGRDEHASCHDEPEGLETAGFLGGNGRLVHPVDGLSAAGVTMTSACPETSCPERPDCASD